VLSTYLGHRWRAIEEHLNDVLGKQSKEVGDEAAAANHFLALLQDCGAGRPPATQAHYLTQFLESIRRVAAKVRAGEGCKGMKLGGCVVAQALQGVHLLCACAYLQHEPVVRLMHTSC
jgi:hypothetical protein